MPKNASTGSSSTSAIVSGVVIIIIILTFAYLLMNGEFAMSPNGGPMYTPNDSSGGGTNTRSTRESNSNSTRQRDSDSNSNNNDNGSNGGNGSDDMIPDVDLPDVDLGTSDDEVSVDYDEENGLDVDILEEDDGQDEDIDIGL